MSHRQDFFKCFRPVFFPLFVTGCLAFRLNAELKLEVSIWNSILTNIGRLMAVGCFVTGWGIKVYFHQFSQHVRDLSPLIQFLGLTEMLIVTTTYLSVMILLEIKKYAHIDLYERAYELDRILTKEFGVNFNYSKSILKNTITMTVLCIYCAAIYTMYIVNLDPNWRAFLIAFGYISLAFGAGSSSYAHLCIMDYLRIRFRLFQKMFRLYFSLSPKQEEIKRERILALLGHYQKYHELIQEVNRIYGNVAIANFFHDFTQTSSMVFVLCHKALESKPNPAEYIFLFLFVLPRIVKVISTAVYSQATINESKICSQIIATYDEIYPVKEIRERIDAYLLWKKHNQYQFTIGKALISNFGLAYSFFQGIGNYILILIQLKFQETSIEERLRIKFKQEIVSNIK